MQSDFKKILHDLNSGLAGLTQAFQMLEQNFEKDPAFCQKVIEEGKKSCGKIQITINSLKNSNLTDLNE